MTVKINEFNYQPKANKTTVKRAIKWLKNNKNDFKRTANFAFFQNRKDLPTLVKREMPCHNAIQEATKTDDCVATETYLPRPSSRGDTVQKLSIEEATPFMEWFVQKSMFSKFILNGDNLKACLEYGLVVSTDTPQPIFQAIMLISRGFLHCSTDSFLMFNELTQKRGVPCEIAYVFCFNSCFSSSKYALNHIFLIKGAYRAFPVFTIKGFSNFLQGKVSDEKTLSKSFRENRSIYGVFDIFDNSIMTDGRKYGEPRIHNQTSQASIITELFENENFKKEIKAFRQKKTGNSVYKPPNPFVQRQSFSRNHLDRQPNKPFEVTNQEIFDFIIPYILNNKVVL